MIQLGDQGDNGCDKTYVSYEDPNKFLFLDSIVLVIKVNILQIIVWCTLGATLYA